MVPFFADLLEFASNIGKEDNEEEKPKMALALAGCGKKVTSLVVTRPNVVLGSLISNKRERKSRKREEGEAEEPRCHSPELSRPCLGPARPTAWVSPIPAWVW
jgi:hypothetical protein